MSVATQQVAESGVKRRQVYFVQAGERGLIKIGVTRCARTRLRNLQIGSPDKLRLLGVQLCATGTLERELHERFAVERARGEWFSPSPALMTYIKEHARPALPRARRAKAKVQRERQAGVEYLRRRKDRDAERAWDIALGLA